MFGRPRSRSITNVGGARRARLSGVLRHAATAPPALTPRAWKLRPALPNTESRARNPPGMAHQSIWVLAAWLVACAEGSRLPEPETQADEAASSSTGGSGTATTTTTASTGGATGGGGGGAAGGGGGCGETWARCFPVGGVHPLGTALDRTAGGILLSGDFDGPVNSGTGPIRVPTIRTSRASTKTVWSSGAGGSRSSAACTRRLAETERATSCSSGRTISRSTATGRSRRSTGVVDPCGQPVVSTCSGSSSIRGETMSTAGCSAMRTGRGRAGTSSMRPAESWWAVPTPRR